MLPFVAMDGRQRVAMQATDILFMGREYFSMVAMLPQIPACMIHAPQRCGVRRAAPLFYRNSSGMMNFPLD